MVIGDRRPYDELMGKGNDPNCLSLGMSATDGLFGPTRLARGSWRGDKPKLSQEMLDAIEDGIMTGDCDEETRELLGASAGVRPGIVDQEAITYFRYGNCAMLAIEIHRATGWPLVMVTADKTQPSMNDSPMVHVMVRTPEGRLLDICGLDDDEDVIDEWSAKFRNVRLVTMPSEKALTDVVGDGFDMYSDYERVLIREFAVGLINETIRGGR